MSLLWLRLLIKTDLTAIKRGNREDDVRPPSVGFFFGAGIEVNGVPVARGECLGQFAEAGVDESLTEIGWGWRKVGHGSIVVVGDGD